MAINPKPIFGPHPKVQHHHEIEPPASAWPSAIDAWLGGPPPVFPPAPFAPKIMQYRSIDGSGNNLAHTDYNTTGTDFARIGPAHFADGVDTMADGPNARMISNVVVGDGDAAIGNSQGLSAMMYAWGQFTDHDLNATASDGKTHIDIAVPAGDPNFAEGTIISMTRAVIDPATGVAGNPALAVNSVTAWLDGSMVYGSTATIAASLRGAGGTMAVSAGNNLPISNGMFMAGDGRAQENPSLTALQTLFVREHNYQAGLLGKQHPSWTADQIFNQAKAIVVAEMAHITYSEYLPHLLGARAIGAYHGYNASVDPRMTEEFAGAAYRFGHSIVSDTVVKLDNNGAVIGPEQSLKDVFFQSPAAFTANGGTDGVLRHLGSDLSQELDVRIVDSLRNFLIAPPAFMDLAAINIQRGRDLGLGPLNETRVALGFKPYTDFSQITSDSQVAADLKTAYGDINAVELWVGGLAENHATGAFVGETFQAIIARQFIAIRDGDRFYYENQGFDAKTLATINHTSLADIVLRNSDTNFVQSDMFVYFERRTSTMEPENPTARQLIIGANGRDTLIGAAADDLLVAGIGTSTMTGGGGADVFVFATKGATAVISDFVPGMDKIEFAGVGVSGLHQLSIRSSAAGTVIVGGGERITLTGVTSDKLSASDFILKI